MSPVELWWLVAAHRPVKMYGNLTEDQATRLYEMHYGPVPGSAAIP